MLTKTFLKPEKSFSLPLVRRDRIEGDKGGLLTLIKDTINYTEICSRNSIECHILNIKLLSYSQYLSASKQTN